MDNFEDNSFSFSELALVENFEDSLSGIGVDITDSMFSMREAISALPDAKSSIKNEAVKGKPPDEESFLNISCTLKASTSPATKLDEDTLTYLNQGYPYELKLEAIDNETLPVRSVVKVCFFERRMQFMERDHWDNWRHSHPCERVLDIDIPHSHGFIDLHVDKRNINCVCISWNLARPCGVYLRLNSISTEFTPKKHGGEKGVPFRIQVDTFGVDDKHLHSCACQVKVFKPKGADRKQKTDREKIEKKSESEKCRFRSSNAWTELAEVPYSTATTQHQHHCVSSTSQKKMKSMSAPSPQPSSITDSSVTSHSPGSTAGFATPDVKSSVGQSPFFKPISKFNSAEGSSSIRNDGDSVYDPNYSHYKTNSSDDNYNCYSYSSTIENNEDEQFYPTLVDEEKLFNKEFIFDQMRQPDDLTGSPNSGANSCSDSSDNSGKNVSPESMCSGDTISVTATPTEVTKWLKQNRFENLISVFQSMSGLDISRLSRSDVFELVSKPDAVRLINALTSKPPRSKLTLYFKKENESDFHAVYLYYLTYVELLSRLAQIYNADSAQIHKIVLLGPVDITIAISDDVVGHFDNEECFIMKVLSHSQKPVIQLTRYKFKSAR